MSPFDPVYVPQGEKLAVSSATPGYQLGEIDLTGSGKNVTLYVNGLLQNEGVDSNPSFGPICMQSEGSPIEFRNIYIEPLN